MFDANPLEIKAGKLATLELFAEAKTNYLEGKLVEAAGLFSECWRHNQGDRAAKIYWECCQSPLVTGTKIKDRLHNLH